MAQITIEPQNPLSLTPERLADFIAELSQELPDIDVKGGEGPRMRGYGVTWWEVVRVTLSEVPADLIAIAIERSLFVGARWMRRQFQKDAKREARPRPRIVIVLDADGHELGTAALRNGRQTPMSREADRAREEKKARAESAAIQRKKKKEKRRKKTKEKRKKK